ncbi:MAG: ATP-binding cassette domain-containing protein [Clostridia bacterium]|nr:ATP-binding cassette domain-containing protein [Clostridia bacterium]
MLKLNNISFKINDEGKNRVILDDVSYNFELGKNYVITGANGCGKSTLAKIIMGIIPATSGQVYLNDKDISNLDITERAKLGLAFAMQQPVRFKGVSAQNLLEYSCGGDLHTSSACEYLAKVGLCAREYLTRSLDNTLSGGELKRIEIASVLARKCAVNIFDEPEAGIDIWSFNSLVDIFKKSVSKNSLNIIISHQEKLFASADEIILIDEGKIALAGKPKDILPKLTAFRNCKKLEGV